MQCEEAGIGDGGILEGETFEAGEAFEVGESRVGDQRAVEPEFPEVRHTAEVCEAGVSDVCVAERKGLKVGEAGDVGEVCIGERRVGKGNRADFIEVLHRTGTEAFAEPVRAAGEDGDESAGALNFGDGDFLTVEGKGDPKSQDEEKDGGASDDTPERAREAEGESARVG